MMKGPTALRCNDTVTESCHLLNPAPGPALYTLTTFSHVKQPRIELHHKEHLRLAERVLRGGLLGAAA